MYAYICSHAREHAARVHIHMQAVAQASLQLSLDERGEERVPDRDATAHPETPSTATTLASTSFAMAPPAQPNGGFLTSWMAGAPLMLLLAVCGPRGAIRTWVRVMVIHVWVRFWARMFVAVRGPRARYVHGPWLVQSRAISSHLGGKARAVALAPGPTCR